MKKCVRAVIPLTAVLLIPFFASAQGSMVADGIKSLQSVLDKLYNDMLPLCGSLRDVGRALAGFGASLYIAYRVWGHISRAEPIDFYPLMRPFAIGLAIMMFPQLIAVMNGVLEPTVSGTSDLVKNSNATVAALLKQKEDEIKHTNRYQALVGISGEGDRDLWMKYYHKDEVGQEGMFGKIGNDVQFALDKAAYNVKNLVKKVIAIILEIIYEAAALCINTLRTFKLIILAIIGPLVLGLAVFDGFTHILAVYMARYVNIYLWLPIANILGALLGKIQENMIKLDMSQIAQTGDTFFSSYDLGYSIFMIIGIVCFFTVPSIADEVLTVGGGNGLQQKITQMTMSAGGAVMAGATAGASIGPSMIMDTFGGASGLMAGGIAASSSSDYFKDKNNDSYMHDKLSG